MKWAFSEATICSTLHCERMKKSLQRMERKHGPGKAKSIFAHKLGRTIHAMLRHKTVFDLEKFPRS